MQRELDGGPRWAGLGYLPHGRIVGMRVPGAPSRVLGVRDSFVGQVNRVEERRLAGHVGADQDRQRSWDPVRAEQVDGPVRQAAKVRDSDAAEQHGRHYRLGSGDCLERVDFGCGGHAARTSSCAGLACPDCAYDETTFSLPSGPSACPSSPRRPASSRTSPRATGAGPAFPLREIVRQRPRQRRLHRPLQELEVVPGHEVERLPLARAARGERSRRPPGRGHRVRHQRRLPRRARPLLPAPGHPLPARPRTTCAP